eukprot:scaffold115001_cov69-Phaeocystis_antarctica.AAC.8
MGFVLRNHTVTLCGVGSGGFSHTSLVSEGPPRVGAAGCNTARAHWHTAIFLRKSIVMSNLETTRTWLYGFTLPTLRSRIPRLTAHQISPALSQTPPPPSRPGGRRTCVFHRHPCNPSDTAAPQHGAASRSRAEVEAAGRGGERQHEIAQLAALGLHLGKALNHRRAHARVERTVCHRRAHHGGGGSGRGDARPLGPRRRLGERVCRGFWWDAHGRGGRRGRREQGAALDSHGGRRLVKIGHVDVHLLARKHGGGAARRHVQVASWQPAVHITIVAADGDLSARRPRHVAGVAHAPERGAARVAHALAVGEVGDETGRQAVGAAHVVDWRGRAAGQQGGHLTQRRRGEDVVDGEAALAVHLLQLDH